MAISTDRVLEDIKGKITEYLRPLIKNATAEQQGKDVSELEDSDFKPMLDTVVDANQALNKITIESIISEIINNAEFEIPSADLVGLDNKSVIVTVPPGAILVGAGAASLANTIPLMLSGKIVSPIVSGKVKKGRIK